VENAILGKGFNFGTIGSLFHAFTQVTNNVGGLNCLIIVNNFFLNFSK
jgi:hypothetical protein